MSTIPVFFHPHQLRFKPLYEWAFGDKLDHPETTARAESILHAIRESGPAFSVLTPAEQRLAAIKDEHDEQLLTLYETAQTLPEDETFYPSVFPRELRFTGDPTNLRHAGAFCFDSGTPLNARTFEAAVWSATCAFEAAESVRSGATKLAYALSRPPGHHATRGYFGGYCYFNNSAIAARHLRKKGRVALIDIDFHHGNGTQSSFYHDPRVLTVSLHGNPEDYFPFYCGFEREVGRGKGQGYNLNISLAKGTTYDQWERAFEERVRPRLAQFAPDYLVLAAGFDTYHLDPIGAFEFHTDDYLRLGELIKSFGFPTAVIQEGGYYTPDLGRNAVALLTGLNPTPIA